MRILPAMPTTQNLLPGGGGAARGVPFHGPTHPKCQGLTKAGRPCRATAVTGETRCYNHGGGRSPERKARGAALGAAKRALTEARDRLGGVIPREVLVHPAWRPIKGDVVATYQKRAALLAAYAARPEDGGAEWRRVLARFAAPERG